MTMHPDPPDPDDGRHGAPAPVVRHVRTHEEFVACVELQRLTWGAGFRELVPATILKIGQRLGGVTAGAFAADGTLVGFVFGITGVEAGTIVHWSDMLAVRPDAQSLGVGRRLKLFQREAARAVGASHMYWTFDPLVARNAYFNLERLGARVHEYVPDMYGSDTGSALLPGLGTDRFIVRWPIAGTDGARDGGPAAPPRALPAGTDDAPVLDALAAAGTSPDVAAGRPPLVRVAVPSDVVAVQVRAPAEAVRWRQATRAAFQWGAANGYQVAGFAPGPADGHGHYLLARASDAPSHPPLA